MSAGSPFERHAMGLSTHVLDTMHGTPAAGMQVALYTTQGDSATLVKQFGLNQDGRNPDGLLYDNASLVPGCRRCSTMALVRASTMKPVVELAVAWGG